MTDLLDEGGTGFFGKFFGERLALFLETLETQFHQTVEVEQLSSFRQQFGRGSGFAELDGGLEQLRPAFEFAEFRRAHLALPARVAKNS